MCAQALSTKVRGRAKTYRARTGPAGLVGLGSKCSGLRGNLSSTRAGWAWGICVLRVQARELRPDGHHMKQVLHMLRASGGAG
jgi:hypothetical protein